MTRDMFRAILVIAVVSVLRGKMPSWPPAPTVETRAPAVETVAPRPWQPVPAPQANWNSQWGSVNVKPNVQVSSPQIQRHERPLRRVAQAFVEVGDALIGVVK